MVPRLGVGEGNAVNHHVHLVKGGTAHRQVRLQVVEAAASQVKACEVGFHDLWGMLRGHERLEHKGLRSVADVGRNHVHLAEQELLNPGRVRRWVRDRAARRGLTRSTWRVLRYPEEGCARESEKEQHVLHEPKVGQGFGRGFLWVQ